MILLLEVLSRNFDKKIFAIKKTTPIQKIIKIHILGNLFNLYCQYLYYIFDIQIYYSFIKNIL